MICRILAISAALALVASQADAAQLRSASAKAEFKRLHPCPANGKPSGPCGGWVIDHIEPLCAGGADDPANMQWQSVADAKVKDREEVRRCAALRRENRDGR